MLFSPLKIFISAGHSNNDPGAQALGIREADLTKNARDLLNSFSNARDVILDKDWQTNQQYQASIHPADGSVVYDLHFNVGPPSASGTECYVNRADFANKKSLSYRMATEICATTSRILGIGNRGVKPENNSQHSRLGILNLGAGCSVLWEICFITSAMDMQKYQRNKRDLLAEVAKILKKYDDMVK